MDPIPILPLPFEGARIQRESITKQDIEDFGALLDAQVATQSKTTKRRKPIQTVAESELKNVSESFHTEQLDWDEGMR